jgi:hypothetical protein
MDIFKLAFDSGRVARFVKCSRVARQRVLFRLGNQLRDF